MSDDDTTPGVCVGCAGPAATPVDLVCEECARLLEEEDRRDRCRS